MLTQFDFDMVRDFCLTTEKIPSVICGKWIQNKSELRLWADLQAVVIKFEDDSRLLFAWMDKIPEVDADRVKDFSGAGSESPERSLNP